MEHVRLREQMLDDGIVASEMASTIVVMVYLSHDSKSLKALTREHAREQRKLFPKHHMRAGLFKF